MSFGNPMSRATYLPMTMSPPWRKEGDVFEHWKFTDEQRKKPRVDTTPYAVRRTVDNLALSRCKDDHALSNYKAVMLKQLYAELEKDVPMCTHCPNLTLAVNEQRDMTHDATHLEVRAQCNQRYCNVPTVVVATPTFGPIPGSWLGVKGPVGPAGHASHHDYYSSPDGPRGPRGPVGDSGYTAKLDKDGRVGGFGLPPAMTIGDMIDMAITHVEDDSYPTMNEIADFLKPPALPVKSKDVPEGCEDAW